MPARKLCLQYQYALGDTAVMTAAIRDLKRHLGGDVKIGVKTSFPQIWRDNPWLSDIEPGQPGVESYEFEAPPYIRLAKHVYLHYLTAFHRWIETIVGQSVPVTEAQPDIHLNDRDRNVPLIQGRYWLILPGGKTDVTVKHWRFAWWQQLVDRLLAQGIHCVHTGVVGEKFINPPLANSLNLVGVGQARDLINQIYHAEGVICSVTAAMHLAAALHKPCVVLAGGREEWWWEAYTNTDPSTFGPQCKPVVVPHQFLHTWKMLECCSTKGCWRNRVVPIEPKDHTPKGKDKLCKYPRRFPEQAIAECMALITPDHVFDAVQSYYASGLLPPLTNQTTVQATPLAEVLERRRPESGPQTSPKELAPQDVPQENAPEAALLDHPIIGGKVTICVCCYGDDLEIFKPCLDGILASVPAHRMDLRIGFNRIGQKGKDFLKTFPMTKLYAHVENKFKYPLMREMFWDPDCPITTKYLVWFDDDTKVLDEHWLAKLAKAIVDNHDRGARLYGWKYRHCFGQYAKPGFDPRTWLKGGVSYRGKEFQTASGAFGPNGDQIHFVAGWFWAAEVAALREAQVPDPRLVHNGGDILNGMAFIQAGHRIADFNRNKALIYTPPKSRRGYSETFPWSSPQGCQILTPG